MLLQEIVLIIYAPEFTAEDVQKLERLISKHHRLCKKLKIKLTPKSHFLIHYPNIIRKIGPLKSILTRKFEAKHQENKISCSSCVFDIVEAAIASKLPIS